MIYASLRAYAELNAFLPDQKRHNTVALALQERDSVKDVIEAQGVPHTEVDVVLVNGNPVDFSYRVQDGDRISVYPVFRSIDVSALPRAGPPPLAEPCFILDAHLGTLASLLRLVGFDADYRNDYDDETLARISSRQRRILLTRDRGLLKRAIVTYGYHVWETDPEQQLLAWIIHGRPGRVARSLQRGLARMTAGEVQADAGEPFLHASADLEQAQAHGIELEAGHAQAGTASAQGVQEPVGAAWSRRRNWLAAKRWHERRSAKQARLRSLIHSSGSPRSTYQS